MHIPPVASANQAPRQADVGPSHNEAAPLKSVATPGKLEAAEKKSDVAEKKQLDEALENVNKTMQALGQNLEFSVDPDSDRTIIKVIDQSTQEVIRQMPSAEALEIAKALDRVHGLLIRQRA